MKEEWAEQVFSTSLFDAIVNRRSRRVAKGLGPINAGSLSFEPTSNPEPLSELEEGLLIYSIGLTGPTRPDRPFQDEKGDDVMGTPNLTMRGRAAGSPDNAQATHFFLINDTGTYFLKRQKDPIPNYPPTREDLVKLARETKVKVADGRLELPREMPYYIGSNRFVSNVPGSTILMPVVDISYQYINGLMFLLTQPDGKRPAFTDDYRFNFYAGVKSWVKSGYLNGDMKIPLGMVGSMRSPLEAPMLMQNLFLVLQAMGLGGWIHAAYNGPIFMGHPMNKFEKAFQFTFQKPKFRLKTLRHWLSFNQLVRPNPIGFEANGETLIKSASPPNFPNMDAAVDHVISLKYGENGTYKDLEYFKGIYRDDFGEKYLEEVPHYADETIAIAKDVCNYIYDRYGKFPAHADAIFVPGIWLQAHHADIDYYDHLFDEGLTERHRDHDRCWHS